MARATNGLTSRRGQWFLLGTRDLVLHFEHANVDIGILVGSHPLRQDWGILNNDHASCNFLLIFSKDYTRLRLMCFLFKLLFLAHRLLMPYLFTVVTSTLEFTFGSKMS